METHLDSYWVFVSKLVGIFFRKMIWKHGVFPVEGKGFGSYCGVWRVQGKQWQRKLGRAEDPRVWGKTRREVWAEPKGVCRLERPRVRRRIRSGSVDTFISFSSEEGGESCNLLQDLVVIFCPSPEKSLCNFGNKPHVFKVSCYRLSLCTWAFPCTLCHYSHKWKPRGQGDCSGDPLASWDKISHGAGAVSNLQPLKLFLA